MPRHELEKYLVGYSTSNLFLRAHLDKGEDTNSICYHVLASHDCRQDFDVLTIMDTL